MTRLKLYKILKKGSFKIANLAILLFLLSCQTTHFLPYGQKIKEDAVTIEELKENEKKLLDYIEELELYIKNFLKP